MSKIKQPISYPIFTFRWLAIHGIAVPTVFFPWCNHFYAIYPKIGV